MKTKSTIVETHGKTEEFASFFRASLREMAVLHGANKADDSEIRRLHSATRKKLDRIRENLPRDPAARNAVVEHIRIRAGTWNGKISGEALLRRTRR